METFSSNVELGGVVVKGALDASLALSPASSSCSFDEVVCLIQQGLKLILLVSFILAQLFLQ